MDLQIWLGSTKIFLHESQQSKTYHDLAIDMKALSSAMQARLRERQFFVVEAENSYTTYLRFLTLLHLGQVVLLSPSYQFHDVAYRDFLRTEIGADFIFWSRDQESASLSIPASASLPNKKFADLKQTQGYFVVRTSGSSGKKFKLVLHDLQRFITKYRRIGPHFQKTFAFSPAESIAGIETLLEVISHQCELVAAGDRLSPAVVTDLLKTYEVDYFQTTPTFLNLLVVAGQHRGDKLSSLRKIAYGSEPAQLTVLRAIGACHPQIEFMHTYGMSEIGIQKTLTNPQDPSVFQLDAKFNPGRRIEGLVEVRSMTSLIRYLNEDSLPLKGEWFQTFDHVEMEGEYWRVLGRTGDLINLAGRKFFPSEVETLLAGMADIQDVTVVKEANEFVGQILIVKVVVAPGTDAKTFHKKLKEFCERNLPFYMHPHKVILSEDSEMNNRFKKVRRL